jgi:RES domain-containing protein
MQAWRIVKTKHAAQAFTGEGAFQYGGRWNSAGTRVVYVSRNLSLAALEILVHLPPSPAARFSVFRLEVDEGLVETLPQEKVPSAWQENPPPPSSQAIGDRWVTESRSAALAVPSAIVPEETNLLLNPQHPDFSKIRIAPARPFAFDARLLGK